jgi:predicted PurR-regulated permease PerM
VGAISSPPVREQKQRRPTANIIAAGVAIALVYYGRDFLVTLFTAVTIGFLLEPFVDLAMRLRLPRSVASFVVCSLALVLLYLAGVGAYTQIAGLMEDLPAYTQRANELSAKVVRKLEETERSAYELFAPRRPDQAAQPPAQPARRRRPADPPLPPPPPQQPQVQDVRIMDDHSPLVGFIYRNWEGLYHAALLASFIPFLVYFMLSWRDHMRRHYLLLFHGQGRHAAGRSWQSIADMARAYVVGNFVLGLVLTLLSGVFFWRFGIPYFPLVAPLSSFLSLVPYIGLPLALIPPAFAALTVYDTMTPYLVIAAVVGSLHLIAMNLLYPLLVGSRVHLNPLAVTIALMFWGSLWGAIGLVFAIPITAGIKAVLDNVPEFQAYGKLLGD